jgi:hypothetical protein
LGFGEADLDGDNGKLKDKKKKAKVQDRSGAVLFLADSEEGACPAQ